MTNTPPPSAAPPRGKGLTLFLIIVVILAGAAVAWQLLGPGFSGTQDPGVATAATTQTQMGATNALTAEKDSLMSELLETTALITDISQAVNAVQNGRSAPMLSESGAPPKPMTARQARAILLPKIDSLRQRLQAAEGKLSSSVDRVRQLQSTEDLRAKIAQYEQTVASVRKLVATQEAQLATLSDEVTALRSENTKLLETQTKLVATQQALQDSMVGLKEDENTVYWIAGSKNRLLELHVTVEEGSGKVLVFGKGKSLVPARTLSPTDFSPVNKRQTNTITLPNPKMRYRILTRQDLSAADGILDKEGHVRGSVKIRDAVAFWAPSAYLILVEDN